jgi:hypothetical protein
MAGYHFIIDLNYKLQILLYFTHYSSVDALSSTATSICVWLFGSTSIFCVVPSIFSFTYLNTIGTTAKYTNTVISQLAGYDQNIV